MRTHRPVRRAQQGPTIRRPVRSTRDAASSPRKKAPAHSTTLSSQNPPYRPTRYKTTLKCSPSPGHGHNQAGYLRTSRDRRTPWPDARLPRLALAKEWRGAVDRSLESRSGARPAGHEPSALWPSHGNSLITPASSSLRLEDGPHPGNCGLAQGEPGAADTRPYSCPARSAWGAPTTNGNAPAASASHAGWDQASMSGLFCAQGTLTLPSHRLGGV